MWHKIPRWLIAINYKNAPLNLSTTSSRVLFVMALQPRPIPLLPVLALVPLAGILIFRPLLVPLSMGTLQASFGFAIMAFIATLVIIPAVGNKFIKVGIKGRDLLKVGGGDMYIFLFIGERKTKLTWGIMRRPESMGLICASTYVLLLIHFIPFVFSSFLLHPPVEEGLAGVEFSLAQVWHPVRIIRLWLLYSY